MKKIIFTITLSAVSVLALAQGKTKTTTETTTNSASATIYKNALKYGDFQTAINATHAIIAKEGATSKYKDTLALLYFNSRNALSCHLLSKELLALRPTDASLLELNALSLKGLGAAKEAVEAYEKLFTVSQNRMHGYELAQLQYSLSRLTEATATVNQALEKTKELEVKLPFNINETSQQEVPLNAALYNMKGLIAYQNKDEASAKIAFEEALKLFPEFALAKQNKEQLDVKK